MDTFSTVKDLVENDESVYEKYDPETSEPGKEAEGSKSKFRLQNKYLLLTYKTHLNKDEYKKHLNTLKWGIKQVEIAHETGDEKCNYNHTHAVIEFDETCVTKNCRMFDVTIDVDGESTVIHPNIKRLSGKKPFNDALHYISKEDPECAHLRKQKSWVEGALKCETDKEALVKYAKGPSDICGILALRATETTSRRYNDSWENFEPWGWQLKLKDIIDDKNRDPRKIAWIFDPVGNSGKTQFGDWCEDTNPKKYCFTSNMGCSRDAATVMDGILKGGWNQDKFGDVGRSTLMIDMSRSTEDHVGFYQVLEEIQNGRMTVVKYKGKKLRFDKPHLVVFANYMPKIEAVSVDRWHIYKIIKPKTVDGVETPHDLVRIKTPEIDSNPTMKPIGAMF